MNIEDLKTFELEITSFCNAACPGCLRTRHEGGYDLLSLSIDDVKRIFPDERHIKDKQFLLCGALGDPVANKDCYAICEYLISMGGYALINSNASLETESWWRKLGKLSADTNRLQVWFCVDGYEATNYIYRVNTNFNIIKRSMAAYAEGGQGKAGASWIYIIFDHNEGEVEQARAHAESLGFKFATRTGAGNSMTNWVSQIRKRSSQTREVYIEKKVITTTGDKEHSKKDLIMELNNFINFDKKILDTEKTEKIVKSIKCKFYHEGEMFVASNQTLWPCCFLWSNSIRAPELFKARFSKYDEHWNSLKHHSIEEIMNHPWFITLLKESWDPFNENHIPKCIQNCAYDKAHQNEINYVNK